MLLLLACIDVSLISNEKEDPVFDTGDTDVADTDTTEDSAAADDTSDTGDNIVVETGLDTDTVDTGLDTDTTVDTDTTDTSVDTDTTTDTGVPTEIVVSGMCSSGYPYTQWSDPSAVEPELHIVGVYESQAGSGGPVSITVPRTAEMVLVLTSYSSVDWQIDLDAAHQVTEIIVSSYEPTTYSFTGAGSTTVTYVGWIGECGYEYPDANPSGCETPLLQGVVEARVGTPMSSFQGCYAGGDYTIE